MSRMVEADRYCVDMPDQIAPARAAPDAVSRVARRSYIDRCGRRALPEGDP
jgi:DNA-binding FrmR family transcriptional regulator